MEFIANERMKLAKNVLINTDCSIRQVAGIVGYKSASYFSKNFNRVIGMTPQTYRRAHGRFVKSDAAK